MAIPVQCTCGQRFSANDDLAGKRMKCPKCSAILMIPATPVAGTSQTAPIPKPPVTPTAASPPKQHQQPASTISSLFDEEEIGVAGRSAPISGQSKPCPNCRKLAWGQAVVCVECGWSFAEGRMLETKRAPKKRQADNPYGFDEYYQYDDGMYGSSRKGRKRQSEDGRNGPPWESEDPIFGYLKTLAGVVGLPHETFQRMSLYSGSGPPMMYCVTTYVLLSMVGVVFVLGMILIVGSMPFGGVPNFGPEQLASFGAGAICVLVSVLVVVACVAVLVVPFNLFILTTTSHFALFLARGAKCEYACSFRAVSYVFGSLMFPIGILAVFPPVGPIIGLGLETVYLTVALKYVHNTSFPQAFLGSIVGVITTAASIAALRYLYFINVVGVPPAHFL